MSSSHLYTHAAPNSVPLKNPNTKINGYTQPCSLQGTNLVTTTTDCQACPVAPRQHFTLEVTTINSNAPETSDPAFSTETQIVTITARPSPSTSSPPSSTFVTRTTLLTTATSSPLGAGTRTTPTSSASSPPSSTDTDDHSSSNTMGEGETIGLAVGLAVLATLIILCGKRAYKYSVGKKRQREQREAKRQDSPLLFWDRSRNNSGGGPLSLATTTTAPSRSTRLSAGDANARENLKATIRHLGPEEPPQAHEWQSAEEAQRLREHGAPSSVRGEGSRRDVRSPPEVNRPRVAAEDSRHPTEEPSWVNVSIPSYYAPLTRPPRP